MSDHTALIVLACIFLAWLIWDVIHLIRLKKFENYILMNFQGISESFKIHSENFQVIQDRLNGLFDSINADVGDDLK
jgi:hypothetical protein